MKHFMKEYYETFHERILYNYNHETFHEII